jgi:hypothetical protein
VSKLQARLDWRSRHKAQFDVEGTSTTGGQTLAANCGCDATERRGTMELVERQRAGKLCAHDEQKSTARAGQEGAWARPWTHEILGAASRSLGMTP